LRQQIKENEKKKKMLKDYYNPDMYNLNNQNELKNNLIQQTNN